MPDFWQFPTVSMPAAHGRVSGALHALPRISRAESASGRKVWAFLGDGEMDQPESLAAISLAGRERLDNLIFVVNCNLQRLDGPCAATARSSRNSKARSRGGLERHQGDLGRRVGSPARTRHDGPAAPAHDGMRRRRLPDLQVAERRVRARAFLRRVSGTAVADLSDDDIWKLARGGHDPEKVHAAYAQAMRADGRPTVVLAKTVKGFGMGEAGEGQNVNHQLKR